jgi:hypothetical protein
MRIHLRAVARRGGDLSRAPRSINSSWRKDIEVPWYQISAILNACKVGGLTTAPSGLQCEETVRKHGGLLITGVSFNLLGA